MSTPLIGILHPVIITRDFARARHFYEDLLGFVAMPATRHDPDKIARLGGPREAVAEAVILHAPDGSDLEIAAFHEPAGMAGSEAGWTNAGIRSITFKVASIRAMLDRIEPAGHGLLGEIVEFVVEGRPVRVCYVAGPDGVVLTLFEEAA